MIPMRRTDPWGRGYPPGLRTQGRGFDSRWVRFIGRKSCASESCFSYIPWVPGQKPSTTRQYAAARVSLNPLKNRIPHPLQPVSWKIREFIRGELYQRPPRLPCERPPLLLRKTRMAPITATTPIPAIEKSIQLKFRFIGISRDGVMFDELISCSIVTS